LAKLDLAGGHDVGAAHDDKVRRLFAAFPWDRPGYPPHPPHGHEEQGVRQWLDTTVLPRFRHAALALVARIRPIVDAVTEEECVRAGERFVARVDATHLTKSADSIIEKMARRWDGTGPVPVAYGDISSEFSDLGRFRVVTNFLSDAKTVRRALEVPFETPQPHQTAAEQRALFGDFRLCGNAFEDLVHVSVKERKSAERCFKGVFETRTPGTSTRVEVQIQTLLQESWDKKEHVLAYEPTRRGEELPSDVRLELEAMSDMLFVVDRTFDRVRSDLRDRRA
jgi:ppGpp synthetase/RelA/SpoT-type nucleotidyltranferase